MPDPILDLENIQQSATTGELFITMTPEQLAERNRLLAVVLAGPPRYLEVFHVSEASHWTHNHHRAGRAWPRHQTIQVAEDRIGEFTRNPEGTSGGILRIDRATLDALIADSVIRIMPGPVSP